MHEIELHKPGVFYCAVSFAEHWDELTLQELEAIADAINANKSTAELFVSLVELRSQMEQILLPSNWASMLNFEQAAMEGLPLIDALLTNNNLSVNPYPMIEKYIGPANGFTDLLVGEYEQAEIYYNSYVTTKDEKQLLELVSLLWRVKDTNTGKRYPYKQIDDYKTSFLPVLNSTTLRIIYLWFTGCRMRMIDAFPEVFEGESTEQNDGVPGITKLIHAGAGPKNGTRDNIRNNTNLLEFMYECQLHAKDMARLEQKQ